MIVKAIVQLSNDATFSSIVARLKLANKGLEMSQVRGLISSCVKLGLIRKDANGVYCVVKKRHTKKRAATRKPRKQTKQRRRSSIVVAAREVASRTARQAEAAQQVADIFEEFPELREALAKELCRRKRSRA